MNDARPLSLEPGPGTLRERLDAALADVDSAVAAARAVRVELLCADLSYEGAQNAARVAASEALSAFYPEGAKGLAWALVDAAAAWNRSRSSQSSPQPSGGDLVRLSSVEPERVRWLWPGRIPLGRFTILDGDPGLGKSALTLDLAARVSTGSPMPDGSPGLRSPAGVLLLSAEDGLADTIRPRLDAALADVDRVAALQYVQERDADGTPRRRLPTVADVSDLEAAISELGAALLVVDPLVAYLGSKVNAHRDQDVRAGLAGLADLAERTGVAVLAVRHLNKSGQGNPLYRGGGSIGLIAAARSGLLVAPDPDDPDSDRRVLASTKCNLAKKPPALSFRVLPEDGTLRIGWEGESRHDASALLDRKDPEERTAREGAAHVLREELSEGPRPVKELREVAQALGVSWRTVQRAADSLGVEKRREGYGADGRWVWNLPESYSRHAVGNGPEAPEEAPPRKGSSIDDSPPVGNGDDSLPVGNGEGQAAHGDSDTGEPIDDSLPVGNGEGQAGQGDSPPRESIGDTVTGKEEEPEPEAREEARPGEPDGCPRCGSYLRHDAGPEDVCRLCEREAETVELFEPEAT